MATRFEFEDESSSITDEQPQLGTFKCETCGRKFETKKDLLHHTYIHKENPKYDCQVCGKILTSKVGYDRHMGTHNKDKKNIVFCKICHGQFSNKGELEEHHRENHLEHKQFSCEICKAEFSWEENLHKHRRMHLVENYLCEVCKRVFVDTISLKVHMRTHTQKDDSLDSLKPFGCKLCGQRFQYDFSYNAHLRLHDAGLVDNEDKQPRKEKTTKQKESVVTNTKPTEPENNEPYKTFLGRRSVHLKKKTSERNKKDNVTINDPELRNAKVLPAFETPKGYKPYPQMRGLSKTDKTTGSDLVTVITPEERKKPEKTKRVPEKKERKIANKRFGDLNMTEETPFKCHMCERQFRWEVSLNIHVKEHVNGVKKLSEVELRRRRRFAAEKNIKRRISQTSGGDGKTVSPKKSRLVKRTAGSDDEESEDENFAHGAGTNKSSKQVTSPTNPTTRAQITGAVSRTNQTLHEKIDISESNQIYNSGRTRQISESTNKPQKIGHSSTSAEEVHRPDMMQMKTETPILVDNLLKRGSTQTSSFTVDAQNMQHTDKPTPVNSGETNSARSNVTESGSQSPTKKRSKTKVSKLDIVRRSRRLARDDSSQFDTINISPVLDTPNDVIPEPIVTVAANSESDANSSQMSYNSYEPTTNYEYENYSQNVAAEPKEETPNNSEEITERVSDFSSLAPSFFYPNDGNGPVVANLINDDKTIEQVRVVECIRLSEPRPESSNREQSSSQDNYPLQSSNTYCAPEKYTQVNQPFTHQAPVQSTPQRHNSESETVYTDLTHSAVNLRTSEGQLIQRHFSNESTSISAYPTAHQVPVSELSSPTRPYQEAPNTYQFDEPKEENVGPSDHVDIESTNYFDNGESFNRSCPTTQSNSATGSFTQLMYSAAYGGVDENRVQTTSQYDEPENDKDDIINVSDVSTVVSTTAVQNENYVAPPLFAISVSQNGPVTTVGHSDVSAVSGYGTFQGSMLEELQSQSPVPPRTDTRDCENVRLKSFQEPPPVHVPGIEIPQGVVVKESSRATEPRNRAIEMSQSAQNILPNTIQISQFQEHGKQGSFQNTTAGPQAFQQSNSSQCNPNAASFQTDSFVCNSQTIQGQITHQEVRNLSSERVDVTRISEARKQVPEPIKVEESVQQNHLQPISSNIAHNQNASVISAQSVLSQQVGSRVVLHNGSLVQSHVAQSALSTNIQQGLILNNTLPSPQIQPSLNLQSPKQPTNVLTTPQATATITSPNNTTKSKRKERSQTTVPIQCAAQPQIPVVVNQPRLALPVSHTLLPQQTTQPQSNTIYIQNPNGSIQPLQPQGGIQIVNNQGAIQTIQQPSGIQVLTNQGIQTIQPHGGLQVVQNVQDSVSLNQAPQGGFQFVQTANGIQMVPIQPTFPSIQSGLPLIPGYQSQNMGPISMINMNITNNLAAPMQTFQTNLPTLQSGMPVISNPLQHMGASIMQSPQVLQCMNPSGELVTVTPLFVDQMPMQSNLMPSNFMPQAMQLNQGLVHVPLNASSHPSSQIQALNFGANLTSLQQHSDSPLNMVCKENPLVTGNQDRDDEDEKIDVIHT